MHRHGMKPAHLMSALVAASVLIVFGATMALGPGGFILGVGAAVALLLSPEIVRIREQPDEPLF